MHYPTIFMLMSILYEKTSDFFAIFEKSIHCARNLKGKGKWQQDSDYPEDFKVNQFINLKL